MASALKTLLLQSVGKAGHGQLEMEVESCLRSGLIRQGLWQTTVFLCYSPHLDYTPGCKDGHLNLFLGIYQYPSKVPVYQSLWVDQFLSMVLWVLSHFYGKNLYQ